MYLCLDNVVYKSVFRTLSKIYGRALFQNFAVDCFLKKALTWVFHRCISNVSVVNDYVKAKVNSENLIILVCDTSDDFIKAFRRIFHDYLRHLNPLSANPTKWSNTLKQFVGNSRRIVRRIVWACLTVLWNWRLNG